MLRQKVVIKIIPGRAPMRPVALRALPLIMALLIAFFCFKIRFSRQRHTLQTSENSFLLGWTCPLLLGNSKHKRAWSNIKINLWVCHSPPPQSAALVGEGTGRTLWWLPIGFFLLSRIKSFCWTYISVVHDLVPNLSDSSKPLYDPDLFLSVKEPAHLLCSKQLICS